MTDRAGSVGTIDRRDTVELDEVMKEIFDVQDVEARPWETFPAHEGVGDKVLWKDASTGSYAGLMAVAPGASLKRHLHPFAVHHLYVVEGTCRVAGRVLTRGSYLYVPSGAEHRIGPAGPAGCTIFFLYLRTPPR